MFFAEYSDGKSAKIHQVKVTFGERSLCIEGFGYDHQWDYQALNHIEKTNSHFSITKGEEFPFETISFDDAQAYACFQKIASASEVLQDAHLQFEQAGNKAYAFAVVGIGIFLAVFHFLIIPFSIKIITENFPTDMEAKLGESYMAIATQYGIIDEQKTAALSEFAHQINFDTNYDLQFYVVTSDLINAFALPGGKIVLFTALVDSMTNYHQLISLMGHETGHVELRHSLQSIFKEQSYSVIFNAISGGNSKIINSYLDVASSLNSLHSSRSHEQQADEYALKILTLNQADPQGIVELFEILSSGNESSLIPDILSTHPSPKNRIKELKNQIQQLNENQIIVKNELDSLFKLIQTKKDEVR